MTKNNNFMSHNMFVSHIKAINLHRVILPIGGFRYTANSGSSSVKSYFRSCFGLHSGREYKQFLRKRPTLLCWVLLQLFQSSPLPGRQWTILEVKWNLLAAVMCSNTHKQATPYSAVKYIICSLIHVTCSSGGFLEEDAGPVGLVLSVFFFCWLIPDDMSSGRSGRGLGTAFT